MESENFFDMLSPPAKPLRFNNNLTLQFCNKDSLEKWAKKNKCQNTNIKKELFNKIKNLFDD